MPKKAEFYSKTPVVPAKKLAGTNPMPGPQVGVLGPPTVPERPGAIHGLGTPTKHFGHPNVKGSHGWGHVASERKGHLRISGSPKAHQIGRRK